MGAYALPIALLVSTAATVGTSAYQMSAADEAKDAADAAAKEQTAQANRLMAEKEAKEKSDEANALLAEERAGRRATQRQKQGQYEGRRGTILTSPLGIPGEVQTGQKTVLGA